MWSLHTFGKSADMMSIKYAELCIWAFENVIFYSECMDWRDNLEKTDLR
jgi:hypothetical protein